MARQLVAAVAAAFAVRETVSSTIRAITIQEEPGAVYALCTEADFTPFASQVMAEFMDCESHTTYDRDSGFLPTTLQRQEMCACTLLIAKLQTVRVPHCGLFRVSPSDGGSGFYPYKSLVEFSFGLCSSTSSSTTTIITDTTSPPLTPPPPTTATTTTTVTPTTPTPSEIPASFDTPTYTPYTYTPVATTAYTYSPSYNNDYDYDASSSSSSKKNSNKTGIYVGVSIAVLLVATVVGFVVRKRKQLTNGASRKSSGSSSRVGDEINADASVTVAVVAELSPLGRDTYAPMPTSPS